MKPKSIKSLLALALLAPGVLFAQTTAKTTPVGYVSLGSSTGAALPAETDIAISVPLLNQAVYSGSVGSLSGSDIVVAGAAFTASAYVASTPHIVEVTSGVKSGLIAVITANTTNTVTVSVQPGDSLSGIAAGDTLSIRPANTLSSLFAGNTLVDGVELLVWNNGTVEGDNLANDSSYVFFSGEWYDAGFENANNAILYPGESYVLRNSSTTPITSLVVSGEVQVSKHRNVISKLSATTAQDTRFAHSNPAGELIGTSGYGFDDGDELVVFDNNATGMNKAGSSYFYFGGAWYDGGFEDVSTSFTLKGGQGYVYKRIATAAVGDTLVSDVVNYVPSL